MNKKQLAMLEKAWAEEIDTESIGIIQTKSKVADQLVALGYLETDTVNLGGYIPVVIEGYRITHAGIFEYCQSIPEDFDIEATEEDMRTGQVKS